MLFRSGRVSPRLNKVEIRKRCSVIQSDIPGNSINKDMHYKRIGQMGARKYLKESCYHHIEYFVADSLTALM